MMKTSFPMAPERSRIRRTLWLAGGLCMLAIALAFALAGPSSMHAAASHVRVDARASAAARPISDRSSLDPLREDAALNRPQASQMLVTTLLDRYDRSGDADDLVEAMQWFDRDWGTDNQSWPSVTTRIYARYCDHRMLRWHWLCLAGE